MKEPEYINQLLDELKSAPASEISKYFYPAISRFRFLAKPERLECARAFYDWANENKTREPVKWCYAEFLFGLYHFINEEHETSLRFLTVARKQFEELDDREGLGLCSMLIGAIYRTFCNFDLALKVLVEGYNLLRQSGHYPVFVAAAANSIANINVDMHNYEEAIEMFRTTLDISEREHDFYFNIYALHGLGKVSMLQKNMISARDYLEKALALAEKNAHNMHIANSLTELGNLHCHQQDFETAEQLHKQALAIREERNLMGGAVTNCIHLGELYMKQARWKESLAMLNRGLMIAEQLRVKPKMYQVHKLLSEIYHSIGELEKSLHHYKLFHELREQVEQEDSTRKLADAKLIFEAEQTKKENVIIKRQKAEIQRKNTELQETIDELTLARVSRKAKALTLIIAIMLFIAEDFVLGFVLRNLPSNNYFLSLGVKMVIIFSLSPINAAFERYLLKRVIRKKKREEELLFTEQTIPAAP